MGEPIRVLIAEDNPNDAELVLRELQRAGFEPEWRRVDTEADYLQALLPGLDIILSDYSMPQFDGLRALQLLKERGLDVPFILVSGTVGEDVAVAAMKDGANDYLIKDRLARLGAAVRHAIGQRRERDQRKLVETQLHRFVSSSPVIIYALAVKGLALEHSWTSDNVTRLTGHSLQDAYGSTWWADHIHPDDRERVLSAHPMPYALDRLVLEYRFQRKDGSWFWVRDEKRLLRNADGVPMEVVGSWADITERKQAEAQRDELAQQRQLALAAARLGWWHYDPLTKISAWDERYQEIFAVTESQRPNEEILARLHPDDLPRVWAAVEAALDPANPRPYSSEYRINHPDGSVRWVEAHGVASFEGDGDQRRATSLVGTVQDITERRQAEAAVREGESRLSGVVNSAMDAIVTVDAEQRIVLFNTAAERMFRCSSGQAMGRPVEAFIPARFRAGHGQHIQRFGTTGVTSRSMGALGAISGLRADGEEFPIEASISQTEVAGNRLYTVILRDITERKRAERWQAMQHAVTQVLADSSSLGAAAPGIIQAVCETLGGKFGAIWEIDRQRNVLCCAEVWQVPGLSAVEFEAQTRQISFAPGVGLPGRVWATRTPLVLPDVARDSNFPRTAAATSAGLSGAFGFPILLRGEVVGVIDFLGAEMHEPEPELLTMLSAIGSQIGQFIEHQHAEQQLLQAQKMEAVGLLAGGIAHDFNNLLGVILGYGELAARELGAEHKTHRRIDAICKAAERAAALTRQILTFSRKQPVELRICDLNQIVEDVEKMLRRLIGEDVRLAVVLRDGLGGVRADPGQLEQVIMNLAINARDAMPSGGTLIIETSNTDLDEIYARSHPEARPGPYVMLAVGDTGVGMEPATLARIFEPFFTTKELGKGTGLGLAVVYGIVKQSGGSLSVYSEPGRGSTFKIYLPRTDALEANAQMTALDAAAGGSETVLVVEDEQALRAIVAETLRIAGYTVLEALDPKEALVVAAQSQRPIQLLITDVVLPGQSGPELATQIRQTQSGVRVLLMSGYTDRLLGGNALIEPGTPFLGKPFTIGALLRKVREVLDGGEASAVAGAFPTSSGS